MINNITKEEFDKEIKKGKGISLIDFYADWCGPCRMMGPVVEEVAKENKNIIVRKVDCDEEVELAQEFGVMSIPTLLIFKDGKLDKKFIGVTPKEDILEAIK